MQLTQIKQITGTLALKTGLHIGAGDTEMRIGGTDNPVVKNPLDGQPYIPGSSLKGKMRSLLEWQLGLIIASGGKPFSFQHLAEVDTPAARQLLKLFGDFKLSLKVIDGEDLLPLILRGLKLLEADSLGGSGSRGYGKVEFRNLALDGQAIQLPTDPFAVAA